MLLQLKPSESRTITQLNMNVRYRIVRTYALYVVYCASSDCCYRTDGDAQKNLKLRRQ